MALRRLQLIRVLHQASGFRESTHPIRSYSNYASGVSNGLKSGFDLKGFSSYLYNGHTVFPWTSSNTLTVRSATVAELVILRNERSLSTTQAPPAQARKMVPSPITVHLFS